MKYKLELRGQEDQTFRLRLLEAYPLKQVPSGPYTPHLSAYSSHSNPSLLLLLLLHHH